MATKLPVLLRSYKAAEDMSSDDFKFIKLASEDTIRRMNSGDEVSDGILQEPLASGETGSVMIQGYSKVMASAALTIGTFIGPEYVSATDTGKAANAAINWPTMRGIITEAAGAEDDLAGCLLLPQQAQGSGTLIGKTTVTTEATAGNETHTAADVLGGFIQRDPAGGARTDVFPTAALLIAAMPNGGQVGQSLVCIIENTADAAETITMTAGTGGTTSGTMTIAQNAMKQFLFIITGAATYDVHSLGTVVS